MMQNIDTQRHLWIYATSPLSSSPFKINYYSYFAKLFTQKKRFTSEIRASRGGTDFVLSVQWRQLQLSQCSASDCTYLIFIYNIHRALSHLVQNKHLFSVSFPSVFASNGSEASSFCRLTVCHFQHSSGSNLIITPDVHVNIRSVT